MDTDTPRPPYRFGQYEPAQRLLVHLSDLHLLANGALLGGAHDTERGAIAMLDAIERAVAQDAPSAHPDALVITGDLTELGEPAAYRRLRELVEPVADRLGCPVVWVAGNHDERPEMRRDLLDLDASQEPITGEWDLDGLRVIALDSTVPGWHHGRLGDEQRAWLAERLATTAPLGTLLALHHPPLPSHVPMFGILELQDQSELADIVRGSDVRGILAGHLHYATSGTFAGVPVTVAAASCYTMNLQNLPERVNGMGAGQSFDLVHVYADTITHSVVPVAEAATRGSFDDEWYARMAGLSPAERLEAFSRKPPRG